MRAFDDMGRKAARLWWVNVTVLWLALGCLTGLQGAPFAKQVSFTQPDGTVIELWGEGDEYHAVFETLDGYTVVFVPEARAYHYARLAADGSRFDPSGLVVGRDNPAGSGLGRHLRLRPDVVRASAQARRQAIEAVTGSPRRWANLKALQRQRAALAADGPLTAPPDSPTVGHRLGLTLLIDFSDATAAIAQSEIEAFCNADAYTGFDNHGSVRKYFEDNSNGLLSYSNVVTLYIRMTQPKSYYNDVTKDCGVQGNLLIKDALAILKARPDYASDILPTFSALTVDGNNWVMAFNVFYAGGNGGVWSKGLWPHSYALVTSDGMYYDPVDLGNGKAVAPYQITNIGTSLELGTFCHENGHMLCGYPDIYDYGYDSVGGAGGFCLMNSGGHGVNPVQICAYLKYASGWATTTELTAASSLTATVFSAPEPGYNHFYRYVKPSTPTEYFLVENRQQTGRDAGLPGAGVAIWHVDELGNHDNQSLTTNSTHANYEVTLVQADGLWDFQHNANGGEAKDLYSSENTAAGYLNRLDDSTSPGANWWDGTPSKLSLYAFTANASAMSFIVGLGAPVLDAEPAITPGTANTIAWTDAAMPPPAVPAPAAAPASARMVEAPALDVQSLALPSEAVLPADPEPLGPVQPQNLIAETFEATFPGSQWSLYGSPTWGLTTYQSHSSTHSAWCAGSSLAAENGYANSMNAWMVHGPFSLVNAASASLQFSLAQDTEAGKDKIGWYVSTNGANYSGYITSGQAAWHTVTLDFASSPYGDLRGVAQVWVAFIFQSDAGNSGPQYLGAFIDDVTISSQPADAPDLEVSAFLFSASGAVEGASLTVSATIANTGTQAAGASHARLYLATDNDNVVANDLDLGAQPVAALGVGATQDVTWDFLLPDLGAANYPVRILCVVDSAGEVDERVENNTFRATDVITAYDPLEYNAQAASEVDFTTPTASGWIAPRQTTFSGLTPGQVSWYRVQARRGVTESAWSNVESSRQATAVNGRYVFYNQSKWDGNDAAANAADDGAIATDKSPLLPGGTATFANYTSYSRGINGLMLDLAGLPSTPTAGDFTFMVGNTATPSGWAAAPVPASVTLRAGAGAGGADRLTVIWANSAIAKQWLQVTLKANANTALAADDVFYFGNAVAEAGNSTTDARVGAADELKARVFPTASATITDPYDYNRDGKVGAADQLLARNNPVSGPSSLQLITVPSASPSPMLPNPEAPLAQEASVPCVELPLPEEAADPSASTVKITSLACQSDGRVCIEFAGDPQRTYHVEAGLVVDGAWSHLTPTATLSDRAGLFTWIEDQRETDPAPAGRFFRIVGE